MSNASNRKLHNHVIMTSLSGRKN